MMTQQLLICRYLLPHSTTQRLPSTYRVPGWSLLDCAHPAICTYFFHLKCCSSPWARQHLNLSRLSSNITFSWLGKRAWPLLNCCDAYCLSHWYGPVVCPSVLSEDLLEDFASLQIPGRRALGLNPFHVGIWQVGSMALNVQVKH